MKRNLVKRKASAVQQTGPALPALPVQPFQPGSWLNFTYSHGEISQVDGKTHVRSRAYRFENGKLETEAFAGTLDGSVYREAVESAQKLMQAQSSFLLGLFQAFLPPDPRKK